MHFLLSCAVAVCLISSAFAAEGFYDYRPMSDWPSLCRKGSQQSPINIDTGDATPSPVARGRTEFRTMGTLNSYTVMFTGTSLHVEFLNFSTPADVRIPANEFKIGNSTRVREGDLLAVEPIQMHIHTLSEHTLDGFYAPGELHIVTKIKKGESDYCDTSSDGCLAVFGMMLTFEGPGDMCNKAIKSLFKKVPKRVGMSSGITFNRKLNLDDLIPEKTDYYTYLGSLTTPPCREVVTWHVYAEPLPVSAEVIEKHQHMVSFTPGDDCTFLYSGICSPPREKTNHRSIQPYKGRSVYYVQEQLFG